MRDDRAGLQIWSRLRRYLAHRGRGRNEQSQLRPGQSLLQACSRDNAVRKVYARQKAAVLPRLINTFRLLLIARPQQHPIAVVGQHGR
jgi:hypothetical protein